MVFGTSRAAARMCGCVGFGLLVIVRVRSFLVNFSITKTDSEEAVLFCFIIVWKDQIIVRVT